MKKICLIFGGILAIAGNAYAVTSTVTSKDYVDTEVGKKQKTIPVSGTNASTPGTTVVTYTNTAGTIGERYICDADAEENGDCDGEDLVTASALQNATNNLPTTITTNKTCAGWLDGQPNTDENCILWKLVEQDVYGRCTKNSDCNCSNSPDTPYGYCYNHACSCVDFVPLK